MWVIIVLRQRFYLFLVSWCDSFLEMSSLSRELVFLILQFLDEEKFKESVHKLEQESGFFFNMKYFEEKAQAGDWDEVERYLSGFTKVDDNRYSMKIFFEVRKQKYLEALERYMISKLAGELVSDFSIRIKAVLRAYTHLESLQEGEMVQSCIMKRGYYHNLFVQRALVDLHLKCGRVEDVCSVLSICADIAAFDMGRQIHALLWKMQSNHDTA